MYHLVVAAPRVSPYLTVAFPDGRTPLDNFMLRLARLERFCRLESVSVLYREDDEATLPDVPAEWTRLVAPREASAASVLARLDAHLPTDEGAIIWLALDAPLFDVELTRYLVRLHEQSWCDYTFADGFPTGYAPEILRRDVLPALSSLASSGSLEWTRTILFDALSRDINAFDVETEAAMEDYALLRLALTVDTRQNYLLCRRLAERGVVEWRERGGAPDPPRERYRDRDIPLLGELLRSPEVGRT
ncbi:MAG: NTP transferase domain-containing protein, partial [Spirochaetales bacterium]|nr:NTP transferase domain-containing protein [Spirochaetales bacterium]